MKKNNTLIYTLIAVLILAGGYWFYLQYSGSSEDDVGGVSVINETGAMSSTKETSQADQFLAILNNIDQVTLSDRTLLDNPLFKTRLQDFGKPIEDRPIGRTNPFASLSAGSGNIVNTVSTEVPVIE